MPSGKTHEKINKMFLRSAVFISLHIVSYLQFGFIGFFSSLLFLGGYIVGTYYLGPDLDIKSRPFYRWKWVRFIWIPYQKMFGHRSFWTHGLLIGDIIRFLYVTLWLAIPYGAVVALTEDEWHTSYEQLHQLLLTYQWEISCFLTGIVAASTLHIITDYIGSAYKKKKRKK